jgi:hypothetical protein
MRCWSRKPSRASRSFEVENSAGTWSTVGAATATHQTCGVTWAATTRPPPSVVLDRQEYARHCGHADLLRECFDGRVGQ